MSSFICSPSQKNSFKKLQCCIISDFSLWFTCSTLQSCLHIARSSMISMFSISMKNIVFSLLYTCQNSEAQMAIFFFAFLISLGLWWAFSLSPLSWMFLLPKFKSPLCLVFAPLKKKFSALPFNPFPWLEIILYVLDFKYISEISTGKSACLAGQFGCLIGPQI